MKSQAAIVLAASVASVLAAPTDVLERAAGSPKLYLIGDSTMALGGGGPRTQGWGVYLQYSMSIPVINDAVGGTSARSYTTSGRFKTVTAAVAPGDFVVIEFGHNDGGSPEGQDNGTSDCPGSGNQTCKNKAGATIQTFPTYMTEAAKALIAKGAHVIISSQTPDNPWESGKFAYGGSRFVTYAKAVAQGLGSAVTYVDHGQYVGNAFQTLGLKTVDSYFPTGHLHTSAAGADAVCAAFVKGLLCGKSLLSQHVKNSTASVYGKCV